MPDKHIQFPNTRIQQQLNCIENNHAVLTLTSDVITRDVFIEAADCIELKENYIDLSPNGPKQIKLRFTCPNEQVQNLIKAYPIRT